ncbi:unnamed protein product [Closterium sp. NIES-64]|nr:unnamed protein product [Closterium sp. NIES-64]CAI5991843.1 unnamed protein product [Closterium sp. NIES-65]
MPVSLEEYRIGQAYMRSRMQMENTRGSEGVEVVASQPFSDERMGAGHMAHVIYHFHSKAPAWLRALAPHGALCLEEQNWNAYPRSKTVLKCPYLTKFSITIESIHLADRGDSENALGLSEEQVKQRKVERVDIASHERDMWTRLIAKSGVDPSKLALPKAKRGPLAPGWQEACEPVMTAYKMVTVDAPYWGFGKRLELFVLAGERALFLEGHRKMYGWMDEWCELTMDDVRRIEKDNIEAMRKNLALNNKVAPDEYNEDESKDEVEDSQDYTDCSGADLADTPKGKDKAAEGQS